MRTLVIVFFVAILMIFTLRADAGQGYRWIDENGTVHLNYNVTPPPGVKVEHFYIPEANPYKKQSISNQKSLVPAKQKEKKLTREEKQIIKEREKRREIKVQEAREMVRFRKAMRDQALGKPTEYD